MKPSGVQLNNQRPSLIIPYEQLANIYDHIMSYVDYKTWTKYALKIIKRDLDLPVRLLDIGCGTGKFIYELGRNNISADGCDISPAMLEKAKQNYPKSQFWLDALPRLLHTPEQYYSVMTCLYDTVNYLTRAEDVAEALNRIYQLLPVGGIFLFDVVSEICCKTYFDDLQETDKIDEQYSYTRTSHYDASEKRQITNFKIFTDAGVFEEVHTQQVYSFRDLKELIVTKTAFKVIGIYEEFTFYTAEESSNRAHFVLKKECV